MITADGRVVPDSATGIIFPGIYRGFVRDRNDPDRLGRLRVWVPQVYGPDFPEADNDKLPWAWPNWPAGGSNGRAFIDIPEIDASVWVMFEGGVPEHPVWLGCWHGFNTQEVSELPWLAQYGADQGQVVYPDVAMWQPNEYGSLEFHDDEGSDPATQEFFGFEAVIRQGQSYFSMTDRGGKEDLEIVPETVLYGDKTVTIQAGDGWEVDEIAEITGGIVKLTAGALAAPGIRRIDISGGNGGMWGDDTEYHMWAVDTHLALNENHWAILGFKNVLGNWVTGRIEVKRNGVNLIADSQHRVYITDGNNTIQMWADVGGMLRIVAPGGIWVDQGAGWQQVQAV